MGRVPQTTAKGTHTNRLCFVSRLVLGLTAVVSRELTFKLTDSTKLQQGGAAKKFADLKFDAKVSVDYVKDGVTRTASQVTVLCDK
jgi:hypothetical protein